MAETVVVNPVHGAKVRTRARRKISVDRLARTSDDAEPPPLRRAQSVGNESQAWAGALATPKSARDAKPYACDADIVAQLAAIEERTAALLEHSPRGPELTRLLSRADAQTKNSAIAVNKVFLMEGRIQSVMERLEKICSALDGTEKHCEDAPDVTARYARRTSTRTLRSVTSIEVMVMTQAAALNRVEDRVDTIMAAITRLTVHQQNVLNAVEAIAETLEAIEKVAGADDAAA